MTTADNTETETPPMAGVHHDARPLDILKNIKYKKDVSGHEGGGRVLAAEEIQSLPLAPRDSCA